MIVSVFRLFVFDFGVSCNFHTIISSNSNNCTVTRMPAAILDQERTHPIQQWGEGFGFLTPHNIRPTPTSDFHMKEMVCCLKGTFILCFLLHGTTPYHNTYALPHGSCTATVQGDRCRNRTREYIQLLQVIQLSDQSEILKPILIPFS